MNRQRLFVLLAFIATLILVVVAFLLTRAPQVSPRLEQVVTLESNCYGFTADGLLLLTAGSVYDFETGAVRIENGISALNLINASQDGRLLALPDDLAGGGGVFNVETGERVFNLPWGFFSADGVLLVAPSDGVYDVQTGERLLAITGWFDFSADGSLLALENDGLYALPALERRFTFGAGGVTVYGGEGLVVVVGDGVYDVNTGEQLVPNAPAGLRLRNDVTPPLMIVPGAGVYNLETRELLLNTAAIGNDITPSPDGRWIAIKSDGVYETATGERLFPVGAGNAIFSPDGAYLAVAQEALYATATGERLFPIGAGGGAFSPDGLHFAVAQDGVYSLQQRTALFSISGDNSLVFNGAGTLLAVNNDGLYDLNTNERRFTLGANGTGVTFVRQDRWLINTGEAVYDTETGERLFDVPASWAPSLDGSELIVEGTGVYDLTTGEQRFALQPANQNVFVPLAARFGPRLSAGNGLLWVAGDGVYDYANGERLMDAQNTYEVIFHPQDRGFAVMDQQRACTVYRLRS